jgi:hypothetical protein
MAARAISISAAVVNANRLLCLNPFVASFGTASESQCSSILVCWLETGDISLASPS